MADLFKKKDAAAEQTAPVAADANAEAPAPKADKKAKSNKKQQKALEPNQMNFLEQYSLVVEGKKKNLDLAKILKPLIAVAVVVLAIFVLLEVVLIGFKARNKSLEKYINDPQNTASYNEAKATKDETDQVNTQKANIESCIAAIDSYPNVGKDFFTAIANTATNNGVTISNYGYSNMTGIISMSCSSKAISPATTGISQFVRDLEKLGLFDNVTYTGFSGSGEGGYSFQISCVCLGDKKADVPEVDADAQAQAEETVENDAAAPAEEG